MNWYIRTEVCWNNWIALINPLYLVTVWLLLRDVYLSINGMCWDFWFGRDHLRWIDSPQWEWTTANPFIIISFILVFWFPPDLNSHCHWAFIKAAAALRHSNHLGTERGKKNDVCGHLKSVIDILNGRCESSIQWENTPSPN